MSDSSLSGVVWTRGILQLCVSAALYALLIMTVNSATVLQTLTHMSPWAYPGALVTLVLGLALGSCNWLAAMRVHLLVPSPLALFRALGTEFAFNSILPGGGRRTVERLHTVFPTESTRVRAYAAILLERSVRWVALLAFGGLGSLALVREFAGARIYSTALCVAAVITVVVFVAFAQGLLDREMSRLRKLAIAPAILENVSLIGKTGRHWSPVVFGPIAFQILAIATMFDLFVAVNPTITVAQCAVITAIAGIAGTLPIAFKGIGAMEVAIVGVGVSLGIDANQAFIAAILHRLLSLLVGVACGAFYGTDHGAETPAPVTSQDPLSHPAPPPADSVVDPAIPLAVAEQPQSSKRSWVSSEILEFTHDAIIIWEMDGAGILYWNQAAEQLYGYTREEVLGQTTHTLLQTEIAGGTQNLESTIARYGIWVGELRHATRDGRKVQVQGRLALMAQRDGKWLVLEVNRDITDLKQAAIAQRSAEIQLAALRSRARTFEPD
jgi:PAS domain S-box-containing protein